MQKAWPNYAFMVLVALALIYFFKHPAPAPVLADNQDVATAVAPHLPPQTLPPVASHAATPVPAAGTQVRPLPTSAPNPIQVKALAEKPKVKTEALHFVVTEDGLVTVDADIVLGSLQGSDATDGLIAPPTVGLWPGGRVPYHIQANFENPSRVTKALALFEDAPLQLVPQNGETDMVVFEPAASGCKSYVGRVGGKQPIWLGPECGPREIAHEIMHALGFIHEQNRSDRDGFVKIQWDNILPSSKINFELFPQSMMAASGQMPFDYRSIMIYSPTMFAKTGAGETMEPTDKRQVIEPSEALTASDLIRLTKVYGK